jgi:hypothetical protein
MLLGHPRQGPHLHPAPPKPQPLLVCRWMHMALDLVLLHPRQSLRPQFLDHVLSRLYIRCRMLPGLPHLHPAPPKPPQPRLVCRSMGVALYVVVVLHPRQAPLVPPKRRGSPPRTPFPCSNTRFEFQCSSPRQSYCHPLQLLSQTRQLATMTGSSSTRVMNSNDLRPPSLRG